MEKPQKWFAVIDVKNTSPGQDRCVFLLVIFATAMIVTPINPKNNRYIN